ncbi:Lsr2 family DNA-binding protein [Actinomadura alba]|uniref:Lsr2 family protein n=1 Tax=Actinomadura alba TaxID=406431 RepID=A0ABR7LHY6_9ACTN|nr:histone-like nucleoid-structuring protein Lsr2 [Actinomadura alba]MBC6464283.1 Lsr2 family protein [Actinomadura alba]
MTITPPAPPASAERVKELLEGGRTVADIATKTGWPRQRILALINGWKGWLHNHTTDIAYRPDARPAPTAGRGPTLPISPRAEVVQPHRDSATELMARATYMTDEKVVQRELTRVTEALARLRTAVTDVDQRAEREKERKAAQERVETLERELAEARARAKELGGKRPGTTPAAAVDGASPKQIRAWAKGAGIACNAQGKIRRDVVDAYNAAHGGA